MQQMQEFDRQMRLVETATVLAQPHRMGDTRQECASALGRLWIGLKTDNRLLLHAGEEYAGLVRRWRSAWGVKEAAAAGEGGGSGIGPADSTVRSWRALIERVEARMTQSSCAVLFATNKLVIEDRDLPRVVENEAILGLRIIAIEFGLCKPDHPFR